MLPNVNSSRKSKSPFIEATKAAGREFFRPPENFLLDMATAAIAGMCMFLGTNAVAAIAPSIGVATVATPLAGAAFFMCITGFSDWWKPVTKAFADTFSRTKAENQGLAQAPAQTIEQNAPTRPVIAKRNAPSPETAQTSARSSAEEHIPASHITDAQNDKTITYAAHQQYLQ